MRQKSCVNNKSRGLWEEWWETVTKEEEKCKPRLTRFPMYFYFEKYIFFYFYLLHFSPGFCLPLFSNLAKKTKSSAAACVFSLWYISAHMLKISLSCGQLVRDAPLFPLWYSHNSWFLPCNPEGFLLVCSVLRILLAALSAAVQGLPPRPELLGPHSVRLQLRLSFLHCDLAFSIFLD